jgi:hypothetical protein
MKLHVAIPGWLGLATALRLRQAVPSLVVSAAVANETPARPLSAVARVWLQQLFPELKALLADMPSLKLVVARDGESIAVIKQVDRSNGPAA